MEKIKIVIVEPKKQPYVAEVENELAALQKIVGGYIEPVTVATDAVLVCNEEGRLRGLEPNRQIGSDPLSVIYGTFFVCGVDGEEFTSLSDGFAELVIRTFTEAEK